MTYSASFFVPGIPKPQPRPRATSIGGHARMYDPGTAKEWKAAVEREVAKFLPPEPLTGAVVVAMAFCLPRPKSHLRKDGTVKPGSPIHPTGKPDIDNLEKAVMDAIGDTGRVWKDDAQVVSVVANKVYVGCAPGCHVTIGTY